MMLKSTRGMLVTVLLLFSCLTMFAQQRTITGVVTNQENREPVPGVTVGVKGLDRSTLTNEKGEFSILVSGNESVVKFSHVSFDYQELAVGTRQNLTISLVTNNKQLDDVVIVGYGTQLKAHATGAIVTIDAKQLEDLPVSNLAATLAGRFAGVGISGGTARPGGNASITIRNPVILSKDGGSTSPLYVIDDIIRTEDDFNLLDASEVETISVLKDAAAAIYGARAAQGVVIVKTKRGKAGKTQISINSSVAHSDATMLPKVMNGYEHARYLNSLVQAEKKFVADGTAGYLADQDYYTPDELEHFRNNNYDWLRMAWKPSMVTRHTMNISGGSDRATFFAGATYVHQNGNFERIDNSKWTFRASADVKLAEGLKLGLSVSGDLQNEKQYLLKQGGENPENDMRALLYIPQFKPPYVNGLPVSLVESGNQNVIDAFHFFEAQRLNNYNNSRNTGLNVMANLEYAVPFVKGLTARAMFGKILDNGFPKQFGTRYKVYRFTKEGEHNHIIAGDVAGDPQIITNGNRVYFKPFFSDKYQLNGYLSYNRTFGNHQVTALAVVEQSEYFYNDVQSVDEDPIEGAPDNSRFAFGNNDVYETQNEAGNLSYVGRVNYNFSGKYLAEFAFRRDASTAFAPENRWGFFPSVSAGWVVSEEAFFQKNLHAVNFLKFRASVGLLGSDNTRSYGWLQRYNANPTGGAVFGGNGNLSVGTSPQAMPNRGVKWDDNTKMNFGIDARFLRDRLSATTEVFWDHRYNMLTTLNASVPAQVGSAMPSENYSTMDAYGYEISVGWKDGIGRNVNYYVNTFFTWSDAKLIKGDVEKGKVGAWDDPIGRSTDMGSRGYHYEGMFRSQAEVDDFMAKNPGYTIFGQAPLPGMLYYRDIRGAKDPATNQYAGPDGKIDENDEDFITRRANNHNAIGLSLGIGYKSLRLDAVMSGSFGGTNAVEGSARKRATATSNRPVFWTDHWTPENPNAAYPHPYYNATYDVASSFWMRSSLSFMVRSLNLSYSLPASISNRAGINNIKAYISATNPLNFFNPFGYKAAASGSYDTYPNLRTIAAGLSVSL
jgi:TonB-linked SusC/RagA family outer membrane protein